ncbi:MAG TPA: hypothetical protein VGP07_09490 [Polyangia bacterium]
MRGLDRGRSGVWGRRVAFAGFVVLAACGGERRLERSSPDDPVVARVGDVPIRASDVSAQLKRTGGRDARKALDDRVVFEVLAQTAAREAPSPTAADGEQVKSVEVQRLIEREVEPQLTRAAIPEADVRALYERGKRRFVHGRLVQATVVCLFTGARMKDEPRARVAQNAKLLAAYLDAHPPRTPTELEAVAKDAAWTERKVSVTTVWQDEEREEPFPRVVASAVARLHELGDRTPLVGDETGYYLAMYVDDKPAERLSFASVEATLRDEMYEPWRRQRFLRLSMDLAAGHDIEVFPENLAATSP